MARALEAIGRQGDPAPTGRMRHGPFDVDAGYPGATDGIEQHGRIGAVVLRVTDARVDREGRRHSFDAVAHEAGERAARTDLEEGGGGVHGERRGGRVAKAPPVGGSARTRSRGRRLRHR